ncbi:hypothetical protein GCM10009087_17960 [Sphingomonas oligophenolica]|uniref:TetR family transcriptional regulator n=1 Tax=Sphingomonas oligophenolica TaxID=301154 RepID=A0ABU9Y3K1_9SPHN
MAVATLLGLSVAADLFALSEGELERRYLDLVDAVCGALRRR